MKAVSEVDGFQQLMLYLKTMTLNLEIKGYTLRDIQEMRDAAEDKDYCRKCSGCSGIK